MFTEKKDKNIKNNTYHNVNFIHEKYLYIFL